MMDVPSSHQASGLRLNPSRVRWEHHRSEMRWGGVDFRGEGSKWECGDKNEGVEGQDVGWVYSLDPRGCVRSLLMTARRGHGSALQFYAAKIDTSDNQDFKYCYPET